MLQKQASVSILRSIAPVKVRESHSGKVGMFASCTVTPTSPVVISCPMVNFVVNHSVVKETLYCTVQYITCWEGSLSSPHHTMGHSNSVHQSDGKGGRT